MIPVSCCNSLEDCPPSSGGNCWHPFQTRFRINGSALLWGFKARNFLVAVLPLSLLLFVSALLHLSSSFFIHSSRISSLLSCHFVSGEAQRQRELEEQVNAEKRLRKRELKQQRREQREAELKLQEDQDQHEKELVSSRSNYQAGGEFGYMQSLHCNVNLFSSPLFFLLNLNVKYSIQYFMYF